VSRDTERFLKAICADLHAEEPRWRLLWANHEEGIRREASDLDEIGSCSSSGCEICKGGGWDQPTVSYDLVLLAIRDLAGLCEDELIAAKFFWPERSQAPSGGVVLGKLATNLANGMLAIRRLVCLGLDGQARILLRWVVELADLTLAIAVDQDLFSCYVSTGEGSQSNFDWGKSYYKNWKRNFSPGPTRAALERAEIAIGMPLELVTFSRNVRDSTYQWLSQFSHANWPGQCLAAMAHVHNEGYVSNLMGRLSDSSRTTLLRAALHGSVFCAQLMHTLSTRHGWNRLDKDPYRLYLAYHFSLVRQQVKILVAALENDR
jgi:hypothetical protein